MRTYSLIKLICDCISTTAVALERDSANEARNHIAELVDNFSAQCPEIKQSAIERIKEDVQNHLCDIIVANHRILSDMKKKKLLYKLTNYECN